MKQAFVGISKAAMNGLYRLFCLVGRRHNEVLFLSRQADKPSYDFVELAKQVKEAGWTARIHVKNIRAAQGASGSQDGAGMAAYGLHVVKELWLLAHCKLVVLDRYDPVVSLLNFDCEPPQTEGTRSSAAVGAQDSTAEGTESGAAAEMRDSVAGGAQDSSAGGASNSPALHTEFPREPQVLQLWHAFGAYKKFGYQSIGVPEGHLQQTVDTFNIHRNYTWVACSGEGARDVFAEAFSYPKDRVVVFARPEYFRLTKNAEQRSLATRKSVEQDSLATHKKDEQGSLATRKRDNQHNLATHKGTEEGTPAAHTQERPLVLFAPTLRKSTRSAHPFRDLYKHASRLEASMSTRCVWHFHPLDDAAEATDIAQDNAPSSNTRPSNATDLIEDAQVVVTDYSSIAYEAYLLRIPVVFYIADLQEALQSPGLNINPAIACPTLCATTETELAHVVEMALDSPAYALELLQKFVADAFAGADDAPSSVLDFAGLTERMSE